MPTVLPHSDRIPAADPPRPGTADFRRWVVALGERIDGAGLRPFEDDLAALVRLAQGHHLAPVSSSVLADARQPAVARARAFARIATALVELPAHRLTTVGSAA